MIDAGLNFNNQFAQLPELFYTRLEAEKVSEKPTLVHANALGGELIGLDNKHFSHADFIHALCTNLPLKGAQPLAMVYSGHQFGMWAGQLGDGRALLLGQVEHNNQLWDLQLKGAGLTPYSRMGDGRAVMRSSIREYLCAEAMHALGVPTTRSLCLIATGQPVQREVMEPGAILARLAKSHIRFGHFEHLYYNRLWDELPTLANHTIDYYFTAHGEKRLSYEQWFLQVVERTACMIAKWMAVGFCHGVMNTDNMSITGLTIDYGPYGFLEKFIPSHICNHTDQGGRYAYNQQPAVALWNLKALAHALQPILPIEQSQPLLAQYAHFFDQYYDDLMAQKLGFKESTSHTKQLYSDLLKILRTSQADYSLGFSLLPKALSHNHQWLALFGEEASNQQDAIRWLVRFKQAHDMPEEEERIGSLQKLLIQKNPTYILRNWVAEVAIRAVEDEDNASMLDEVLNCMQAPFTPRDTTYPYEQTAPKEYQNLTLSCSS